MTRSRVAERYARSLLDLARERGAIEAAEADIATLRAAVEGSRDLRNLLASPIIDAHRKEQILEEVFRGSLGEVATRFVALIARKGRAHELPEVLVSFAAQLDRERNITEAEITTAVEMDATQKERVEMELARLSGSHIRARYLVDPSLIGGFRARFADRMIDASVQHQLERLHERLTLG